VVSGVDTQHHHTNMKLIIGSRGSTLALWQAEHVRACLTALNPGLEVSISIVQTTGDRITDVPLSRIGDKGLFTKELDRAILDGQADIAVHSLKDVPTRLTEGLALAAVMEREDPRDALLVAPNRAASLAALPPGARIGTSSLRRRAQLLALRPDVIVEDLRGNLDTRMRRVQDGDYDAIVLALAGLTRLGFANRAAQLLDPPDWLPAVGQGALGITARANDASTLTLLSALEHQPTRAAVTAERALLARLEGGCQIPIGALATVGDNLKLQALVASTDGKRIVRGEIEGGADDALQLGETLAADLSARGASEILNELRAQLTIPPGAP